MKSADLIALACFAFWNATTFIAFGFDKWRAARASRRVSEFTLTLMAALGGWPGGGLGMLLFHHKTAKWTFKLKFMLALIPFAVEVWAWWHWRSMT